MRQPKWVRLDVALAIHARQIAEHGDEAGLRDVGLLESALDRPKNVLGYHESEADLPMLAAAYAYGIVKNHPFLDGNKRVAYVVCRLFLQLNKRDFDAAREEKYRVIHDLAAGRFSEEELAEWIRKHLKRQAR